VKVIESLHNNQWSYEGIKRRILRAYKDYSRVSDECALINIRRIYHLSIIAIPLPVICIILFAFGKSYDTEVLKTWSQGIMGSHFVLLLFLIVLFLVTHRLMNKKKAGLNMYLLQYLVVLVIMATGIVIVTFDQLVTTNITPFILICVIVGAIFIIRPLISFIIFLISYIAYYFSIAMTISDPEILLSNRVNGIIAVAIGMMLSITLWRYNYTNIIQKRRIEYQQKQLEQMAFFDPLTDLPNRRLMEKLIKREYSLMQRYGHESVLIIMDVDNFKSINDTYGHPVGDNVLRQLADFIKYNVRESDTVARFGGEEFVILMPNTSLEDGCIFAERLRKLLMEKIFEIRSISIQITSSFGVSSIRDINCQCLEDYYYLADKALYLAKQRGKNRVERYSENTE